MFWKRKKSNESVTFVDLNSGMIDAILNPPEGFASRFDFSESEIELRLKAIRWFENCGKPLKPDLSMPLNQVESWSQATELCKTLKWENTTLEAQNQLTLWLHLNDKTNYQNWNKIVELHKRDTLDSLIAEHIVPFQQNHNLDITFVHCVQWDILGALMENSYLKSGHKAFFFLELLLIYEAGHFPCGWEGEFPDGSLFVY